jgi:hypothetical protein
MATAAFYSTPTNNEEAGAWFYRGGLRPCSAWVRLARGVPATSHWLVGSPIPQQKTTYATMCFGSIHFVFARW